MNTQPATVTASDLKNANWFTSSYSNGGGNCVEVAGLASSVAVRDSKAPEGPALLFSPEAFAALVSGTRASRYGS